MKLPSIKAVAAELRDINMNVEGECDVRLHIWPDGGWAVHYGDASYDQDHRGYWGASSVPGVVKGRVRRFDSMAIARDLLDQVREDMAI